jgi:formamidopyrimidine-DNA glycosylase
VPELPEVQAHAERLTERYRGEVLARFVPLRFTALKTAVPAPDGAYGRPLAEVGRRGKYLLADFGDLTFVVHLMQGGRLREDAKPDAKPKSGQARWHFDSGRAWLLTEAGTERRAGVWCMATAGRLDAAPLSRLGPEADTVRGDDLAKLFVAHPMRLHGFLRDQSCVAGLGRRLANEVCHRAHLSPFASTAKLGAPAAASVADAITFCVEEGLAYERTRNDTSSSADRPGGVHHRTGEPCPTCGDAVREVAYASYTVNYCPTCQTGGRVLADNTTSRFLR